MASNVENEKNKLNKSGLRVASESLRDWLVQNSDNTAKVGVQLGISALIGKTVLRRLPLPFNLIVPFVAEKLILKHGVNTGREMLLSGLRWIKRKTD